MATQYKLLTHTTTIANSSVKVLEATAANTVVASVTAVDSATSTLEVLVKKFGGSIIEVAHAQVQVDKPQELLTAPLALEAQDELYVRTSRAGANFVVSYVEDTNTVAGQSIDTLSDVDTTGKANGETLIWNATSGNWEPGAAGASALNDITDVNAPAPSDNQVLSWDAATSKWVPDGRLTTLYANIKEGTSTTFTDGSNANSRMELTGTTSHLKTGITGVEITETSPGDIEFVVATDATGATAFKAIHIDGTTTANSADVLIKNGANLKVESASLTTANLRYTGTGNASISLPGSTGTLALTSELYTDADADARIAAASVTDLTDVTSAGSGSIITSAERTKLAGIAAGAEVNVNADWNASSGDAQILNKPTLSTVATTGAYSDLTGTPQPYEEDEIVGGQNITMNSSVSVASNRIVDVMGDALADTSNANAKKMLGFHSGNGVCVLQGMVDAGNSISGASAGSPLWLGASGSFSATAPTTATYYSRVVGYFVGTLVGGEVMCYFDPSKDWVQID